MTAPWTQLLEKTSFDTFQGLPWLFENALAHKSQWRSKLFYYNSLLSRKILELEKNLNTFNNSNNESNKNSNNNANANITIRASTSSTNNEKTKTRLTHLKNALEKQKAQIEKLLPELKNQPDALLESIQDRVPSSQFIGKYINNIFRDWAWGEKEVALAAQSWLQLFPKNGENLKCVFLGAGAGRLALEIHQKFKPEFSVVTDINPLLLTVADQILNQQPVKLFEFPHPAKNAESVAIEHTLVSPQKKPDNFHLVYADAVNSPFKEKAFDLVATPWLIDILPISFAEMAVRINNGLADDGLWLNSGPLSYSDYEDPAAITPDEIESQLTAAGFTLEALTLEEQPYLQSPYSMQARTETVVNFRAKKLKHQKRPKRFSLLPDFITDISQPILITEDMKRVFALAQGDLQLLGLLDNKNSIQSLADLISRQSGHNAQDIVQNLIVYFVTLLERSKTY